MKNECCETCTFYKNGWCELFFVEQEPEHKCESDYESKNDLTQVQHGRNQNNTERLVSVGMDGHGRADPGICAVFRPRDDPGNK